MDSEATSMPGSMKLKKDLSYEAVNLALQGEWQRATEVNKAILQSFSDDVEAMNRLVKSLIELGSYEEASAVLMNSRFLVALAPMRDSTWDHRTKSSPKVVMHK